MWMDEQSLNLGQLAEEFAKLLVDVPTPAAAEETVNLEEGERREVTILFLDIVGYTRLAERLDPEQLKFVISNTLQVFTNQIKKCGGTVEKYVGDAIMALFGRSQAHEDDSRRAVAAARAIIDRLEDINSILSQKGISISARIGVNRGLVVTGHMGEYDTVTGEAINIAQRLEANAPENGILISAEVHRDCHPYYGCEKLPPLFVKNKTEPLTVYLITGEIPQAARRQHALRGPILGREAELGMLHAAWQQAKGGRMSLVQILGEPGVGKRALIHALFAQLKQHGVDVTPIVVSADSFGMQPYHALTDLVRDYLTVANVTLDEVVQSTLDGTEDTIPGYRVYLQDLLGSNLSEEERSALEQMEPRARQAETLLAVKRFLTAATVREQQQQHGPLVAVFDNLEWVTHASRDALSQILRTLSADLSILWIFLSRTNEAAEWIPDRTKTTMLTLGPLSADATARLLRTRLANHYVSELTCRHLYERTGGNPFFLEEVIRIVESLGSVEDLASVGIEEKLPSSIKALILSRLDQLPRPLKFALQVGAVAGREFSKALLQHVLTRVQYTHDVDEVVQTLTAEQLLSPHDDMLGFARPMLAEVAYTTILYANRKKLHALVAQWVEDRQQQNLDPYAPYLAEQWERAEEYARAIRYCVHAGRSARLRFAYRDAVSKLERALQLRAHAPEALDDASAVELHLLLINLYEALGQQERWKAHVQAGLALTAAGEANHAKISLRQIEWENRYGDRTAATQRLQTFLQSRELAVWPPIELRANLIASGFAQERGEDDSAYIEAAERLRAKITESDLLYLLDNNVFNHYKNADELKRAEEYFTRVLEAASQNTYTKHVSHLLYCSYMWDRGADFATIVERAALAQQYFREVGWARGVGWGAFYQGAALWRLARVDEAICVYQDGLRDMERVRDQFLLDRLELLWAAACLSQGDMVAYQLRKKNLLERAVSQPESEQLTLRREFALFEGQILDQPHELTKTHDELLVTSRAPLAKVQQDEYHVTVALVAVQLGRIEEAQQRIDQVRAHILDNEKWWLAGMLARVDGLVAAARQEFPVMNRRFAESAVHLQRIGAAYDCFVTYRVWWNALRNHRLEKTPEGASVKQRLGAFPLWQQKGTL